MIKKFKFTDTSIKALPANERGSQSTELEVSDTQVQGLKCLVGKQAISVSSFVIPTSQRSKALA
jgi:hypothetical protein